MSHRALPFILLLAAGSSSRMAPGDKLLEMVEGQPLLRRLACAALATAAPVVVALPPDRPLRAAALIGLAVQTVVVPAPAEGLSASLRAGLSAIPHDAPVMLLLADLPEIDSADLAAILARWQASPGLILRATAADGTPGHPVCFPPDLRRDLLALTGDEGARTILARHAARVALVALPGCHATTDLDTPVDWERWRAARQSGSPAL